MLAGMTGYDVVNVAGTDMPRFIEPKLLMPLDKRKARRLVEPRPRDPAHLRHLGPGQRLRRALHVGLGRHRLQHGPGARAPPRRRPLLARRADEARERREARRLRHLDARQPAGHHPDGAGLARQGRPRRQPRRLSGRRRGAAAGAALLRHLRQHQLHQRPAERRALRRGELVGRLRHRRRPRRGGRHRDRPRVLRARDRRPGLGRLHGDPGRRAAPGERPRLPRLPAGARGDRRLHQLGELRQRQRRLEAVRRPGDPRRTRRSTPTRRR